jgi:hypothetical protein
LHRGGHRLVGGGGCFFVVEEMLNYFLNCCGRERQQLSVNTTNWREQQQLA